MKRKNDGLIDTALGMVFVLSAGYLAYHLGVFVMKAPDEIWQFIVHALKLK